MAKSHNQKAKILYLAQMLRGSGENRVLSMQEILTGLLEYGIQAERKSIYDDIEALRDFGMDVKFKRGRPGGYYLAGQAAAAEEESFGAAAGSGETAGCEETVSFGAAAGFEETVGFGAAVGSEETVDLGMAADVRESADRLDTPGEEVKEKAGETGWKFARGAAVGEKPMRLLCNDRVEDAVKEYFGSQAEYKDKGAGCFTVTAGQLGDSQFFGWLTAMGKEVHILKPRKLAQAYRDYLKSLAKEYKGI